MQEKVYKLFNKTENKWADSGVYNFSDKGKFWRKKSHVKNHLTQYTDYLIQTFDVPELELVEFDLVEVGRETIKMKKGKE